MAGLKRFNIPSLQEMEEVAHSSDPLLKNRESTGKSPEKASVGGVSSAATETSAQKVQPVSQTGGVTVASTESFSGNETSHSGKCDLSKEAKESTSASTTKSSLSNSLLVNPRQRGNPILKSVRSTAWEYSSIVPDYVMGQSNCALFLSLRYHQLHPNYIHERLKQLGRSYDLRVMLVQVDVKEAHHLLQDLAKICILADCTLILAFSAEEAGRYLETYKVFENKPPEVLMEKTEDNFMAKFTDCLTRVKSVNKTDCSTLLTHFGSLSNIADASEEDLSLCPGFGPQKAQRLHSLFQEPFLRSAAASSRRDVMPEADVSPHRKK